jgi:hypothetical protein
MPFLIFDGEGKDAGGVQTKRPHQDTDRNQE